MRPRVQPNYQDLLKALAVIIMVMDHAGLWFASDMHILRIIGRFGIATWLFFAGYNYSHPKPILLKLGLILSCLIYLAKASWLFNMLAVFYIGQWYIYLLERYRNLTEQDIFFHIALLVLLSPLTLRYLEYSTLTIAFMIVGRREAQGKGGLKYFPLLGFSLIVLTYIMFRCSFNCLETFFTCASAGLGVLALVFKRPQTPITLDVRILSRHTLWIYSVHLALFAIIGFIRLFL